MEPGGIRKNQGNGAFIVGIWDSIQGGQKGMGVSLYTSVKKEWADKRITEKYAMNFQNSLKYALFYTTSTEALQQPIASLIGAYYLPRKPSARCTIKSNLSARKSSVFSRNNRFNQTFPSGWTSFPMDPGCAWKKPGNGARIGRIWDGDGRSR